VPGSAVPAISRWRASFDLYVDDPDNIAMNDVNTIANYDNEIIRERIPFRENSNAALVLWRLPTPLPGSHHAFKHLLAFVRCGVCLVRFRNQARKCDHRHVKGKESKYTFLTPEQLIQDFPSESRSVDDEDPDS
jgi:hypothetical protein